MSFFKREKENQLPVEPKATQKVTLGNQVAVVNSPFNIQTMDLPYNPDELWQKRQGYDIYYEMLKDDQVKAVLETKKNTMIGGGWEIISPTDVEGNEIPEFKEITNFVKNNFENLYDGSIDEAFYSMLTAIEFGFSLSEQIYKMVGENVLLSRLVQVPPDTIEFIQDEFGNITEILQDSLNGKKSLPINKFAHFIWSMRDGNPYGNSDLRPAYIYWFSKLQVIKYRNIFLERHGFPIAVAKYNPNEEGQIQEVQKIVKSIQAAASVAIPESMDLEYKQPKIGSADPFDTALRYFDKKISTSLLLPDLLGFNDTQQGSLALGKQHFELFTSIVNRYRKLLEQVINNEIIKKLVNLNFPGVTKYPRILFKPVLEQDHTDKVNTFIKAVEKAGVVPTEDDVRHIKQVLGFPSGSNSVDLEKISKKEEEPTEEDMDNGVDNPENDTIDLSKFSSKINNLLEKSRDQFVLDLIGDKLGEIKSIHYMGHIKAQVYRALATLTANFELKVKCEKAAFEFTGNLSSEICKELRNINISNDKMSNIKLIESIFNKYTIDYAEELKNVIIS